MKGLGFCLECVPNILVSLPFFVGRVQAQGLGCRRWGLEFWDEDLGFRVASLQLRVGIAALPRPSDVVPLWVVYHNP